MNDDEHHAAMGAMLHRGIVEQRQYEAEREKTWRPIETAPKDGTRILVFGDADGEVSLTRRGKVMIADWRYDEWRGSDTDYYAVIVEPTHWMPLPEPPEAISDATRT